MERLYYLQQKLGMTHAEALALGTIIALFLLGLGARFVVTVGPDFDDETYAEVDSLFALGVERLSGPAAPTGTAAVPSHTEVEGTPSREPGVIDLNLANHAELQRLPGVGPALAERIIEYREAHGPFRNVSQLTAVRGIGAKTLDRMRDQLRVSDSSSE
jgi:competence ComEA-like helix-hairpin-helix protein